MELFRQTGRSPLFAPYLASRIKRLPDAYDYIQMLPQLPGTGALWGGDLSIGIRSMLAGQTISDSLSSQIRVPVLDADFERGDAAFQVEPWRQRQFESLKNALSTKPIDVVIEGHAAPDEGDADTCKALAGRRADAVKAALVQAGIPSDRIETVNYGSSKPFCTDTDPVRACDAWNRRVHFTYVP